MKHLFPFLFVITLFTKAGGTRGDRNKKFHAMETKICFCFIAWKCFHVSHSQFFCYRNIYCAQKCFQKHYTKSKSIWFCIMFLETFLCEKSVSIQKIFVSPGLETFFMKQLFFSQSYYVLLVTCLFTFLSTCNLGKTWCLRVNIELQSKISN